MMGKTCSVDVKLVEEPNILFISDIRTVGSEEGEEREETIINDMRMQEKWIELVQPDYSLLKFRLPYNKVKYSTFNYLEGW